MQISSEAVPKSGPRSLWFFAKVGLTLLVVALAGFAVATALQRGFLSITEIKVRPLDPDVDGELFSRVQSSVAPKLSELVGKNILSVRLPGVRETVMSDRRVQQARVIRRFPDTLVVEVKPKHPVLNLLNNDGRLSPIAVDASLLPPVEVAQAFDLPILRGPQFRSDAGQREAAIALVSELPSEGLLRAATLSEIAYSKDEGFSVRLTSQSGKIILGEGHFAEKFKRINQVLDYLYDRSLTWRILDARFTKKVVVKLQDQT
jgi:cell division septal protein FtsQ